MSLSKRAISTLPPLTDGPACTPARSLASQPANNGYVCIHFAPFFLVPAFFVVQGAKSADATLLLFRNDAGILTPDGRGGIDPCPGPCRIEPCSGDQAVAALELAVRLLYTRRFRSGLARIEPVRELRGHGVTGTVSWKEPFPAVGRWGAEALPYPGAHAPRRAGPTILRDRLIRISALGVHPDGGGPPLASGSSGCLN